MPSINPEHGGRRRQEAFETDSLDILRRSRKLTLGKAALTAAELVKKIDDISVEAANVRIQTAPPDRDDAPLPTSTEDSLETLGPGSKYELAA